MRCPCQHDLRLLYLLVFLDGDQVGKCLEWMSCSSLHAEYRLAGILDELIDNHFVIIVLLALELRKRANSDHIAVASHYRNCLEQMLRLVAVHDDPALCLKFPCSLVDVKNYHVHSEVQGRLLSAQTGAQTGVEEYHQKRLVPSELLIREWILLYIFRCCEGVFQIAKLCYRGKMSHIVVF